MVLLMDGSGVQRPDWHVDERVAAGYCRVYLIESGEVSYTEGGITQTLSPGSAYIFPPSVPYFMHHSPQNPLSCLWFHIDFFPVSFSSLIQISPSDSILLENYWSLLKKIFLLEEEKTPYGQHAILSFGEYLLQMHLPENISPMAEAAVYIRNHFRDSNLNVNGLGAHFSYSPEHFIRTFTRAMGITPYQYLMNMRLYEARRMLLENHSVSETAQAVGYDNTRSFSHAFQKKYGVPPGEFRKNLSPLA